MLDSTVLGGTYWELELACLDYRDGLKTKRLSEKKGCAPTREGLVLDSTVLGGTFTPSLSLGAGVVRNLFLQDRTQREDLFALPPSSKFLNPPAESCPCWS